MRNVRFSRGISRGILRGISRGISRESCAPEHSYSHSPRTSTCILRAHLPHAYSFRAKNSASSHMHLYGNYSVEFYRYLCISDSGFSNAALPKRTTRTVMWTCITGLRRSSCRRGGTHSLCWWHEDAPKSACTLPKRTGLGASWTFNTWTTMITRLTLVANSIDEPTLYQIASKRGAQSKILRLLDELAAHCQTL